MAVDGHGATAADRVDSLRTAVDELRRGVCTEPAGLRVDGRGQSGSVLDCDAGHGGTNGNEPSDEVLRRGTAQAIVGILSG